MQAGTPSPAERSPRHDVIIAGGGYVGLSLALALKRGEPGLAVAVVDPAPADAATRDSRASAIAASARRMLAALGVWAEIEPAAEAITEMIVTDSRLRDPVRPVFLTFAEPEAGEPFAHMVPNAALVGALARHAADAGVERIRDSVANFTSTDHVVTAELANGGRLETRLLVAADGARSRLRDLAGIGVVGWNYRQSGIVATVEHERPHGGRAEEHFLPAGPFAILPLRGNRSSLVWTERQDAAERLLAGDDFTLETELSRRFGHRLGAVRLIDRPRAFPLGLDPGAPDVLARYERWRRFDTVQMAIVTDGLNRLFSNDNPGLRALRDFGLGLVDRLPRLKQRFIDSASHPSAGAPRLLRGEAI